MQKYTVTIPILTLNNTKWRQSRYIFLITRTVRYIHMYEFANPDLNLVDSTVNLATITDIKSHLHTEYMFVYLRLPCLLIYKIQYCAAQ
jgi:hypothetical protein